MYISHSKQCIPHLSLKVIALTLYPSIFWVTIYSQVINTMFISSPVFSDLFFFTRNIFSALILSRHSLCQASTSPLIGGHHSFLIYHMMNVQFNSSQLLIIARGMLSLITGHQWMGPISTSHSVYLLYYNLPKLNKALLHFIAVPCFGQTHSSNHYSC